MTHSIGSIKCYVDRLIDGHLEEIGYGLKDCWCINPCCENDRGDCICPDCWCQLSEDEMARRKRRRD